MLAALIVLRTLVVVASFLVVARRAARERRTRTPARDTWASYRLGLGLLAASSVLETVLVLLGASVGRVGPGAVLVLRVSSTAGCFFLYHGISQWYRAHDKSRPSGRVDWLAGASCVLGLAGLANVALALPDATAGPAQQLRVVHVASLAVLLTAVAFFSLTLPRRLRGRATMVAGAVGSVLVTQVVYLLHGPELGVVLACWAAWACLTLSYAVAACLPPIPLGHQQHRILSVPLVSSTGLVLGLVALVGAGLGLGPAHWALWFGAAAIAGSGARLVRLVRDLADHDRARRQARTDDLTGLANRREFLDRLRRSAGEGSPFAVLLLDLDRFKEVNDQHGHAAGDELLTATAMRLGAVLPHPALLARLGGDEFAVLLPGADAAEAVTTAGSMLAAVSRVDVVLGSVVAHTVGASVGVATSTGADGLSGEELLRRADGAMYTAKVGGLGVALHDEVTDRAWRSRVLLSEELHEALGADAGPGAADAFEVHYQPQVSLVDDEVVGVEALVRWNHPRLGLLAPGAFLDVLEERGLMPALTVHVARRAVADLAGWRAAGHDLRLSINTSSTYLSNPQLLELLDELAEGTDPSRIVVEVTETSLMNEPERALATCRDITARGFSLSIDDFGTGYSSLAYLANLPATELKIDRAFTSRALVDDRITAIVAGTVDLAHHLGLRVVAEGVEDTGTLELLRGLGIEESQGYLHSRPVPAGEFLRWLRGRTPAVV
ncbi:putative bifunctional diguanylate cyclase/phosphodiesterase [Kineococcus sp. GCM10028916]|uniref:putative bifunctional diguanylate cyclase/phosphodiesterase n=1 Tax=Kineococcus sp. GCM10028916 TaxID=3273394 RepID=UPI003636358C